jgi:ABC-type multidrug transport system fused ATPase/permease subunit
MYSILKLIKYLKHYKRYVWLNIVSNIMMVIFSIVSIPILIPFLQILLGQEQIATQKPDFQWNIQSLTANFNYQLSHIITTQGKEKGLLLVCTIIIVAFFIKNLFRYFGMFFMNTIRNSVVRDIRQALFDKILRLPLSYFSEERKGDLISRISNDVLEVEWSILNVLESIVREPLLIIGAVLMMVYISPQLTIFVFILIIITGIVIGGIGRRLKKESAVAQEKMGNIMSVLEETLGGIRIIKGFNAEDYQTKKFQKENNSFRQAMISALRRRDMSSPLTEFLGIVVVCILIWFGFKQVSAGHITAATFIAFIYAFFTIIDPAKSFSNAYYHVQRGTAALERIDFILDAQESITDPPQPIPLSIFKESIEFRNVAFYYKENEKQILKNINLIIPKGKIIALVGASGAGKSTIVDLLPRFYDTSEGEILLDGINIKQYSLHDLRQLMGIVSQEALLFNDTIYNNIVFGLKNITEIEVENAAKAANAHDFIVHTEGGYQSNIGDRGTKLSGGQRQRLTIARAILKNPPILIFDEATSALDSESEKLVQDALTVLMKNRTAIIIAHRLSTVQHADEIIVLKNGEIMERGTHDNLYNKNGEYRKLVDLQGLM